MKTIEQLEQERNAFISRETKPGTPTDCTLLVEGLDCLERNLFHSEQCESCREYNRVLALWEEKQGKAA
jgi:hypothetical protein